MNRGPLVLLIALVAGLVNGLLGIGGGTIVIPAMVFLLSLPQHQAHGTSLAIMLPTTVVSVMIYYLNGNIDMSALWRVVGSNIVGGYIGALIMPHIPAARLRQIFGLFMLIAGVRMVM